MSLKRLMNLVQDRRSITIEAKKQILRLEDCLGLLREFEYEVSDKIKLKWDRSCGLVVFSPDHATCPLINHTTDVILEVYKNIDAISNKVIQQLEGK